MTIFEDFLALLPTPLVRLVLALLSPARAFDRMRVSAVAELQFRAHVASDPEFYTSEPRSWGGLFGRVVGRA